MAQNAENCSPNVIILDPGTYVDGVFRFRIRVQGDTYDRLQIHKDGTIKAGDGASAPTVAASAQGVINTAFDARLDALEA